MVKSKIPEKKDIVIMMPVEPGAAIPKNLEYRAYMINIIENIKEKKPSTTPKYKGFRE